MNFLITCFDRYFSSIKLKLATLAVISALFMFGCVNIWNAGDLAVWVKDRAVEQGCRRGTIELEEWYTETDEGNFWRGTCQDAKGGTKSFEINVDPVWTPSEK